MSSGRKSSYRTVPTYNSRGPTSLDTSNPLLKGERTSLGDLVVKNPPPMQGRGFKPWLGNLDPHAATRESPYAAMKTQGSRKF